MMRYMSTGADFTTTGDAQQRMCKASVHNSLWEAVDFVYYNHERYIRWPQTEPELEACAQLYDVNRFSNKKYCVGAVDCTHIGIKKPSHRWQEEAFVNRNSYHSINTMVRYNTLITNHLLFPMITHKMGLHKHSSIVIHKLPLTYINTLLVYIFVYKFISVHALMSMAKYIHKMSFIFCSSW